MDKTNNKISPPNSADSSSAPAAKPAKLSFKRILPLLILIVGGTAFWLAFGEYLSFEMLKSNRETLTAYVAENQVSAALIFMAIYALVVAFSIPGGVIMTLLGGFLFGNIEGTILVTFAATLGSLAVFLAARTAFADYFHSKVGHLLHRLEEGFQENALSYLLFLRLVPLFPFWLVNIVPAFLGVSTRVYFIGTLIGIIPGTFVFVSVGNGLGAIFEEGGTPDLSVLFTAEVLTPILGLALISLIPVAYKKLKKRPGKS
ncbi:TVP38/TMEM64 family protein [Rhodovibrionaceae bacterium A322]